MLQTLVKMILLKCVLLNYQLSDHRQLVHTYIPELFQPSGPSRTVTHHTYQYGLLLNLLKALLKIRKLD